MIIRKTQLLRNLPLVIVLAAILLTSCSSQEEGIQAHNPWMMPAVQGSDAAVYFKLYNHTSNGDLLTGASSEVAVAAKLDEGTSNNNLVQLRQVEHVLLPASTEIKFNSGALQVTLLGLKQDVKLHDEIEILLHFLHTPDLTVKVSVSNFPPPEESGEHH